MKSLIRTLILMCPSPNNTAPGFTAQYGVHDLVYFELLESMADAIHLEKQLKAGSPAQENFTD